MGPQISRRRILAGLTTGLAGVLAGCIEGPSAAARLPVATPAPTAARPRKAAPTAVSTTTPTARPAVVVRRLKLALAWPDAVISELLLAFARSGLAPADIVTRDRWAIGRLEGAAAGADLISPPNPQSMARGGHLQSLDPVLGEAAIAAWHRPGLATINRPGAFHVLPLALTARPLVIRTDLLSAPIDLTELHESAGALTRRDQRFVTFAGIDLSPATHDPQWLLFAGGTRQPATGFSRGGSEMFRSFFHDPGLAFRRDHAGGSQRLSAIAGGRAAMAFALWPTLRRQLTGSRLRWQLTVVPTPAGISALEGGGRYGLAAPAGAGPVGPDALTRLDGQLASAVVARAGAMAPANLAALRAARDTDRQLDFLLDPELALYDWRLWPDKSVSGQAGTLNRAIALGSEPVGQLLDRFESWILRSRG